MNRSLRALAAILLPAFFLSCAATGSSDPRPIAEDPVCACNGELGCICVRVDASTPRASFDGKTYYFCSDGCRRLFERDPTRYLPHLAGK